MIARAVRVAAADKDLATLLVIVLLGALVRAALGAALYLISTHQPPLLATLHTGDGFWHFAPDGRGYYLAAVRAVELGLGTVPPDALSPAYIRVLGLWMMICGAHPMSAVLFNLVCYALGCAVMLLTVQSIPRTWRRMAGLLSVGAFAFSPSLIIVGTQPLKDTLFALLAVCACAGAWFLAEPVAWRKRATGCAAVFISIYLTAGMRAYYAFLLWLCLALLFMAALVVHGRAKQLAPFALAVLAAGWLAFAAGAGREYSDYAALLGVKSGGSHAVRMLELSREHFVQSGGRANVAANPDLTHDTPQARVQPLTRLRDQLEAAGLGLSTIFVPISFLRSISVVKLAGGASMLFSDLDTLFLDATLIGAIVIARRRWSFMQPNIPVAVFLVSLIVALTGAMAYVVTNYGALVRLRLMLAVPIWMWPLAMCRTLEPAQELRHRAHARKGP